MKNLKTVGASEKAPNYSDESVKVILARVPFDYAVAIELAKELGKVPKSIVAKVKRLEADESIEVRDSDDEVIQNYYIAKEAYTPKTGKTVEKKSSIVESIEVLIFGEPNGSLKGLDKAPKLPLERLRTGIILVAVEYANLVVGVDDPDEPEDSDESDEAQASESSESSESGDSSD